ncbi:MAG: glycosyltransferase family 4 protein [Lachnospiraceae bacterium]|nr:glycosyltransferase family 4 protein [Lachnospiraceae bacterium]
MPKICYIVTIPSTIHAFFVPQLKFLAENGFDVTVVCSHDEGLQDILGKKIRFYPIEIPRGISVGGMLKAIYDLYCFFKKEKFDLVQYSTPNAAFCASIAACLVNIRIRNYHLMGFRFLGAKGLGKIVLKHFEKLICVCSTCIECVSQSNLKLGISERLFSESKATVIWNGSTGGVDLKKFDYIQKDQWRKEVRQELKLLEKDVVFGYVGRITKDKGVNELLQVFFHLQNSVKLLFVGSSEGIDTLDQQLWNWAKESDAVIIHDEVTDVERYFAAIDVLLLPSYREGFGNVIIEAGAMAVPSIVSDIPGPIDVVIDGQTGLICRCKNVESLEDNIIKIMDNSKFKELGINAYEYVISHFDREILCEKIMERKCCLLGEYVNELKSM